MERLLPVLRPAGWEGADDSLFRRLLPLPGSPVVAFAWSVEPLLAFVSPERVARGGETLEDVEAAAVRNLVEQEVHWAVHDLARPEEPPVPVATVQGERASEHILVPSILRGIATELDTGGALAVAIPYEGALLATALENAAALLVLAQGLYAEPRGLPLTPWVFLVQRGRLTGRITPPAEPPR